jgi:hypothetical protein
MSVMPTEAEVARYELDALRAIAARVLDTHVNENDTCVVCGCAFPCGQECLAEHNLAVRDWPPPERVVMRNHD